MLKAKQVLCPVCGAVFTEACYGNNTRRERLILKHVFNDYFVEPLSGDMKVDYTLVSDKLDLLDGMPERIKVKVADGKVEDFARCCPKCTSMTYMPRFWGKVPSYVVCIAGKSGEGKTCLAKAMATADNLSALASAGYPWRLTTPELEIGENVAASVTPVDSIGSTKVFRLRSAEDRDERMPPLANILFRDSAGELFNGVIEDNHFFNFLQKHDGYPGPDGLIFLHSAQMPDSHLLSVYQTISKRIPRWPATAVVVTHADKIQKWEKPAGDGTSVKLMDKDTFPTCLKGSAGSAYYNPKLVRKRRVLQDSIVRSRYYGMFNKDFAIIGEKTQCFLVKSCYQDTGGNLQYDHPINIMDPIIWLINDSDFLHYGGESK